MAQEITIKRLDATDRGVFGHLTCPHFDCVTLERHDTLIPAGRYKATKYHSPDLNRLVLLLHDVPGREFVEVHNANWERQLKGCIAVGKKRNGDAVETSIVTLENLLHSLQDSEDIYITVA